MRTVRSDRRGGYLPGVYLPKGLYLPRGVPA